MIGNRILICKVPVQFMVKMELQRRVPILSTYRVNTHSRAILTLTNLFLKSENYINGCPDSLCNENKSWISTVWKNIPQQVLRLLALKVLFTWLVHGRCLRIWISGDFLALPKNSPLCYSYNTNKVIHSLTLNLNFFLGVWNVEMILGKHCLHGQSSVWILGADFLTSFSS